MKQLKYILPLLLTIITLSIYNPIETLANSNQYNITFINNGFYASQNGAFTSNTSFQTTSKVQIINNTIILNSDLAHTIEFWSGSTGSTFIGALAINDTIHNPGLGQIFSLDVSNAIPVNATYFSLTSTKTTQAWSSKQPVTFSQFETLTVSYSTLPPAPLFTPTTFPNLTFIDNQTINVLTGDPIINNNWVRTELIDLDTFPTLWNLTSPSRPNFGLSYYESIAVFYDTNYNIIGYWGREVRNSNTVTVGNRLSAGRFDSSDELNFSPTNAKYVSWLFIKQTTGNADISNGPNEVLNPSSGDATYNDISTNVSLTTTQRRVQWAVTQTNGNIIIILDNFYEVGTDLTAITNSLSNDPNLSREGFEFTGFDGPTQVPNTSPTVKIAQFTQLVTYTVTFQDWDGTVLGTDTVVEGQPANPPLIPTRTGYTFSAWLPPIANIQGNITTVAQYTPNTYLVTWTSDNIEIKIGQAPHDTTILSHAPFISKENHLLIGWRIEPTQTLVTSGQLITGPLSLTAVWEQVPTYTVIWRDPSFNTLKIEYVIQSGLATAPNYNPGSGLILAGWTPDPTQPITANTTFIAVVQNAPTPPTPENYSPIADLFGGVIGASIGAIMTLGTIELYGITLNSLIFLFISMTVGLWILKAIRG